MIGTGAGWPVRVALGALHIPGCPLQYPLPPIGHPHDVHDDRDRVAAYGLFWYDPVTATGLVEPMRTEDDHQRRGLARHILTNGLDLLAAAGAERIKICYEPDNPASGKLYRSVGFEPDRQTVVYAGPTSR